MTKQKTVLLIDGDVLVYQIGLAAERPIDWGDDDWTLHADFAECKDTLVSNIEGLIAKLGADQVRFALSCKTEDGYRRELDPCYKSNRKATRKPVVHRALRQHLLDNYDTILRDKLEADDVLGILATQPTEERRIIVSVDKDFRSVPCHFYRTNEDVLFETTPEQALLFHATQTLTGDAVDGYKGIPGCGPKTAEKILAGIPTKKLWPTILASYKDAGLSAELALTNARLARILQHGDYDIKTGAITLWNPPKLSSSARSPKSTKATKATSPRTSAAGKP